MIEDITAARDAALRSVGDAPAEAVEQLHAELLGKRSDLSGLKASLASLSPDDRREAGRALNEAMSSVSEAINLRVEQVRQAERLARIEAERLDLTEAPRSPTRGHLHLVTQAWERLEDVFVGLGFTVAEGPEVETDWYNFEALNMGEGHPARGEFDTLFVGRSANEIPGESGILLRTHTSPVQIRAMLTQEPPIRIVAPGRVFRRDTPDSTHMPVFHQIEGLVVDRSVTMADLAGTIEAFTQAFFGPGFSSRLRPSYFPFTEPSAEFDIRRPDGSWLELGGCGMVHPSVLSAGGLNPEEWSGFAFGFGIDRMAVMRHSVSDIRDMYVNDIRFIEQF